MTRLQAEARTTSWIVALIAGLVGGLAAALLMSVVRSDVTQAGLPASLDAIEREIQNLAAALRDRSPAPSILPQHFEPTEAPRDMAVEPLQPSAVSDLQAAAARLESLLSQLETVVAAGGRPLTIPEPTVTAAARESMLSAKKYDDLPEDLYLANYQQVLDRYGRPQGMFATPTGVRWIYADLDDKGRKRLLDFADGHVIDWAWQ